MFETEKRQMNTSRRKQELNIIVLGLFGFGSFENISDLVLKI
jgi:hypothetical protein